MMDRASKPNLWLHNGVWYCAWISGEGYVGHGATPLESYWEWRKWHKLDR